MSQTCKTIDAVTKPLPSKPKLVEYDSLSEDDCPKDVQTSVNVHAHKASQSSFNDGDTLTIKDSEDDSPKPKTSKNRNHAKVIKNRSKDQSSETDSCENSSDEVTVSESDTESDTSEDSVPIKRVRYKRTPLKVRRRLRFAPHHRRRKLRLSSFQKMPTPQSNQPIPQLPMRLSNQWITQPHHTQGIRRAPPPTNSDSIGIFGRLWCK